MNQPTQEILNLSHLIKRDLAIPNYQRPYKWKSENVILLLEDIFDHVITREKTYRIGNIILHRNSNRPDEKFYVVDGQQRLTSLSILLSLLGHTSGLLMRQEFSNKISTSNIVCNGRYIKNWIDAKIVKDKQDNFKQKVLEKLEIVLFTVYKEDEAFQLFDSQNSRGKALEPYDLLKAFHLREMNHDTEEDRSICVERWEKSIENGTLKPILANHLFKIRKWCKNESKYDFKKEDIDEFKGVSLHLKQSYPYESAIRMLDGFVSNAQNDKFLRNSHIAQSFPFSITMPIINGKRFFEYIDYYIKLKHNIFLNEKENEDFCKFYQIYCLGTKPNEFNEKYGSAWRVGDAKVRNLYENILLLYFDKFGNCEFKEFYEAFYKAVYKIRCDEKSIRTETILKNIQLFHQISNAIDVEKLKLYQYKNYKIVNTNLVKGIEIIKNYIINEQPS